MQMGSTPRERGGKISSPLNTQPGKGPSGEEGELLPSHVLRDDHKSQKGFVQCGDKVAKRSCACHSSWNIEGSKESM